MRAELRRIVTDRSRESAAIGSTALNCAGSGIGSGIGNGSGSGSGSGNGGEVVG